MLETLSACAGATELTTPETIDPSGETTEARIFRFATQFRAYLLAGTLDLCSNNSSSALPPDVLRKLAVPRSRPDGLNKAVSLRPQELFKRLGADKVTEPVERAQAGESARSLAKELSVASSALTRMLKAEGVELTKRKVSDAEAAALAKGYAAGATMRELEAKHGLSHGAVLRALHRGGIEMRAKAPRKK